LSCGDAELPIFCLLVKQEENSTYEPFDKNIENFEYEWGYQYRIRVEKIAQDLGPNATMYDYFESTGPNIKCRNN